jgi:hypothetical protein
MPEALHGELARASERAGLSLNGYINEILAAAVGRRPPVEGRRNHRAERLLLANLLVIVVVGVLAVVLLVQAIR